MSLKFPMKTVTSNECNDCGEVYNNGKDLFQHRREVCCRGNYPCSNCPKYFQRKNALQHHLLKFHSMRIINNVFKCAREGCMFITAQAHLIKTHLQQAHHEIQDDDDDDDDDAYVNICPHLWCYKMFDCNDSLETYQIRLKDYIHYYDLFHICNKMTLTPARLLSGFSDGPVVCSICLKSQSEEGLEDELEKTGTYSNEEMREISQSESEIMTSLPSSPCDEFMRNIGLLRVQNRGESTNLISVSPSQPTPIILQGISLAENTSPSRSETSEPPSPLPINNSSNSPPSDRSSPLLVSNLTLPQAETSSASPLPPPLIMPMLGLIPANSHSKLLSNNSSSITSTLEQDSESPHSLPPNLHSLQNVESPEANTFKNISITTQDSSPQAPSAVLYPLLQQQQSVSMEPQDPLPLPNFLEKLGLIPIGSLPLFTRTPPVRSLQGSHVNKLKLSKIKTSAKPKKRKRSKRKNFTQRKRSVKLVSKLSKIPLKLSVSKTSTKLTPQSTKISTLSVRTFDKLPTSATRRSPLEETPPAKPCLTFFQAPPVSNDFAHPIENPSSPPHQMDKTVVVVQMSSLPQNDILPISTLDQTKYGDSSVPAPPPKAVVISPFESGNAVSVEGIDNVTLSGQSTSNSDAVVNEDALKGFVRAFSEKGLTALLAILNGYVEEYPY